MVRLPHIETGTYISGAGHLGLLAWLALGGLFYSAPELPLPSAADVVLLSEAEFAAMTRAPEVPEPESAPPPEPAPESDPAPAPEPEPVPEPQPQPEPAPEPVPEPVPAPTPPPPAERVAPDPVPQPEPEAQTAPERQEATIPEATGADAAPALEATAPEAATTQIITEATETDPDSQATDLVSSPRPPSRPSRPQPEPVDAARPPEPAPDPVADAVAAAVAEANEAPSTPNRPDVPVGPPMTTAERDGLRVAVQQCWNVGSLSSEALRTTVTVGVEMEQSGRPVISSIRMIGAEGGSEASARQAFEAARRAIIRCGSSGFDLPVEKFAQWRDIEMTFNPERMRIR